MGRLGVAPPKGRRGGGAMPFRTADGPPPVHHSLLLGSVGHVGHNPNNPIHASTDCCCFTSSRSGAVVQAKGKANSAELASPCHATPSPTNPSSPF